MVLPVHSSCLKLYSERQTTNCAESRNLSDECVTMPADLIAVGVSRKTSNKRPAAFSFGLSIRRCELWAGDPTILSGSLQPACQSFSSLGTSASAFPHAIEE